LPTLTDMSISLCAFEAFRGRRCSFGALSAALMFL